MFYKGQKTYYQHPGKLTTKVQIGFKVPLDDKIHIYTLQEEILL
jgi:hypothetical protein